MDLIVVLVLVLVIVLVWRGPKTLPQLGAMFGRGIRAARQEADRMRSPGDAASKDEDRPAS
jgi:Sec-independent protein translocase protein TatA